MKIKEILLFLSVFGCLISPPKAYAAAEAINFSELTVNTQEISPPRAKKKKKPRKKKNQAKIKKEKAGSLGSVFAFLFFGALALSIVLVPFSFIQMGIVLSMILGAFRALGAIAFLVGGIGSLVMMHEGDPLVKTAGIVFIVWLGLAVIATILVLSLLFAGIL